MPEATIISLLEAKGIQANALLQQLDETFPPTNPSPEDTIEKIMYGPRQRSILECISSL